MRCDAAELNPTVYPTVFFLYEVSLAGGALRRMAGRTGSSESGREGDCSPERVTGGGRGGTATQPASRPVMPVTLSGEQSLFALFSIPLLLLDLPGCAGFLPDPPLRAADGPCGATGSWR